jgi:phosphoribosylaminoimidazolecarboxamide formyltransferase/IMP cyclohydrolase
MTEIKIRRALISLTDKSEAVEFARGLVKHGAGILSTGGTAKLLREGGVTVTDVAEVTRFPEILDGRVKTLHPMVYGGILSLRDNDRHQVEMTEHGIEAIDLVAVNLYAFAKKAAEPGVTPEDAMGQVDIGGPCMIRAAAKNHAHVAVVTDPADYPALLEELDEKGGISLETRRALAVKAFNLTSAYDAHICDFLRTEPLPERFTVPSSKGRTLRYGENPHQKAAFYRLEGFTEPCVANARRRGGKKLSYNNLLDTDAAFELVKEFTEPAAVMVKHTNPCGAAVGANITEAFHKAYDGDPVSAFGGIAALNRPVDLKLAEEIADPKRFLEVLIAPDVSDEALEALRSRVKWGKSLRVLCSGDLRDRDERSLSFRSITGGVLAQSRDLGIEREEVKTVTEKTPDQDMFEELHFAWKVVKHVKSNAIALARAMHIVGVGAGQMSRIDSTRIAGEKAGERSRGSVLASDAFFPFRDCVDQAKDLGVRAIIQPGGSVRDQESIDACNEHGMVMVFTGHRHFRH